MSISNATILSFFIECYFLMLYNNFGDCMNNLRKLREERKLSLRQIEIKTGINNNTFSRYETGNRDLNTSVIKKLASFFEVTTDYLLNYDVFCLYVTYEPSGTIYRIAHEDYIALKDYIYFNEQDKRCININKYVNCDSKVNCSEILNELSLHLKFDKLFDKGKTTTNQFNDVIKDKGRVILTIELLDVLKDAIS